VINNPDRVSPDVRAVVEEAIERIGYVPNRAARSLVTRRTNSIALVVREAIEFGFADSYLSSIVVAASQSLTGTGFQLAVMMANNDADHAKLGAYVRGGHVDGVILVSVHENDPLPRALIRAGVPMVLGGRPVSPLEGACYVDVDNHGGAGQAARHLIGIGRTRLAMIAGPSDMAAAIDRLDGFRAALREHGEPPPLVSYGDFTPASGQRASADVLRRLPDVNGIFAANDRMAIGAMRGLKDAGYRVPDDVAVVGFDDIESAQHTEPPLTTVRQEIAEQARLMLELVLAQVEGRPAGGAHLLPTRLVVRGST
jgi:DNA-binding LacI/PurR family transcriptional regulator